MKIGRDGTMKHTDKGIVVGRNKVDSGETGESTAYTFFGEGKEGTEAPDPAHTE